MSLSSNFKTDADLERKGVAIEFGVPTGPGVPEDHPNDAQTEIFICRAGRNNPDYQKVADRINKPFRRAMQVGALPQSKQDELTREIFAEAGVVGWKYVLKSDVTGNDGTTVDEKGNAIPCDVGFIPYTKDNAIALFKRMPDLYATLIDLSVDRNTFLAVQKEEDAKNSVNTSAT